MASQAHRPGSIFCIQNGPSNWDLMMTMFGDERFARTITFTVVAKYVGTLTGYINLNKRVRIRVRLSSLAIPCNEWVGDNDFIIKGTASQLKLLNQVTIGYNSKDRSGTLTID